MECSFSDRCGGAGGVAGGRRRAVRHEQGEGGLPALDLKRSGGSTTCLYRHATAPRGPFPRVDGPKTISAEWTILADCREQTG
eukprot:6173593-Pleurochrysis_carterae.AAC.1